MYRLISVCPASVHTARNEIVEDVKPHLNLWLGESLYRPLAWKTHSGLIMAAD